MPWPSLGRALAHRNYRLFIAGQSVSVVGTWIQQVALGWLAYRLSGSAFLLGAVGFSLQIPTFCLAPFGGVMADRWNRQRALRITQCAAMIQALLLLGLTASGVIQIWQILILSLTLGCINAFDFPLRQSFLVDMVPLRQDLPNAIAINSSIMNGARLVGPAIAGFLIAVSGEAACFLLNAISYLAVIVALSAMRDLPQRALRSDEAVLRGLHDGLAYAVGSRPILALLLFMALLSLSAMPLTMLMPVFAADVLQGGPTTLGFLTAASGLGSLVSALVLASKSSVLGLGRQMVAATLIFGVAMIAFGLSRQLGLSLFVLLFAGYGMMFAMASSNTLLQTIVDDDKRGRVMSLYTMSFMGAAPVGSLVAGGLADLINAPVAVGLLGAVSLAVACWFARQLPRLRELVQPIYEGAGIVVPLASALQTTTDLTLPPEEA